MELLKNLFEGYPDLWGGGVAHSVLILSLALCWLKSKWREFH